MTSATSVLGFEEIENPEQAEIAQTRCLQLSRQIPSNLQFGGGHMLTAAKENARELHRLLVAIEAFWK